MVRYQPTKQIVCNHCAIREWCPRQGRRSVCLVTSSLSEAEPTFRPPAILHKFYHPITCHGSATVGGTTRGYGWHNTIAGRLDERTRSGWCTGQGRQVGYTHMLSSSSDGSLGGVMRRDDTKPANVVMDWAMFFCHSMYLETAAHGGNEWAGTQRKNGQGGAERGRAWKIIERGV